MIWKLRTNLEFVRTTTNMHDHRAKCCKQRIWAIEQLGFPNARNTVTDLVFRITNYLFQIFTILGRWRTTTVCLLLSYKKEAQLVCMVDM